MSQISLYLTSIAVSLLFGIGVSLYIRKPLFTLLVDVCGTQERARFWLHITILSYLLVSAAIGLAFRPETMRYEGYAEFSEGMEFYPYESSDYAPIIYDLGSHLGRTLFGLLIITGFMAFFISRFIRRQDREALQAQPG